MQATTIDNVPQVKLPDIRSRTRAEPSKYLLRGKGGSPANYAMYLSTTSETRPTPRHRHNFEQVRFGLEGEFCYTADKKMAAGQVFYVPEGAYYGPQTTKDCRLLTVQFGGPSGYSYLTEPEYLVGYDKLTAKGKFENGYYTFVDADGKRHNRDAFEALWETITGKAVEYPAPRYAEPILMDPRNYAWVPSKTEKGVAHKWLGEFSERRLRVGFIKLDAGAGTTLQAQDAPEMAFVVSGVVSHQGRSYPQYSAFGWEPEDGAVVFTAEQPTELYFLKMHSF